MRIISQKGIEPMLDLPYEHVTLTVKGKLISAIIPGVETMLIANYSTPEKAQAAMKNIHKAHPCYVVKHGKAALTYAKDNVFQFPPDEEV